MTVTVKGSIVAMAGSKIESSKFYYFEKSVNLRGCVLLYVANTMAKAQESYLNNGSRQDKARQYIWQGYIVTSANIVE